MSAINRQIGKSGQALVEASCGLIVIFAISIALVNLAVGIYAISRNDALCRNAAGFAAAGNPNEAERRVRMIIEQSGDGFGRLISPSKLILPLKVEITSQPIARRDPDTDRPFNPGGLVTGIITVRTQIEIRPLAMDLILRQLLRQHEGLVFQSSHSFPIHYVMPPS